MSENGSLGRSFFEKSAPILLLSIIALAFVAGALWQKVSNLEKGGSGTAVTTDAAGDQAPVEISPEKLKSAFDKALVKFGKNDAEIVFIEAADPSCPFCHIAGGLNPELAKEVGERFQYKSDGGSYVPPVSEMKKLVDSGKASYAFVYKNGHGNGEMGTKALYCANEQGKFWEAHDKLYTNAGYKLLNEVVLNDKSKTKELVDFIGKIVDSEKLKSCLDSGKYDGRLSEDEAVAGDIGVTGTPNFYINTKNFAGAYSWEDMKSALP